MANALATGAHAMVHPKAYEDDPTDEISTRAGLLKLMVTRSPRHAWMDSPRLNPDWRPTHKKEFDLGTCMHFRVLGDPHGRVIPLPFDSFRKADAKAARDAAYDERATPILESQLPGIDAAVVAARAQLPLLSDYDGEAFTHIPLMDGVPEMTMVWRDGPSGVLCRGRLDWWHNDPTDRTMFWDYKTTKNAEPGGAARRLIGTGAEMQAAFYMRGITAITGIRDPRFGFIMQETVPPYAVSAVEFDRDILIAADQLLNKALEMWAQCIAEDKWPGYSATLQTVNAPGWYLAQQRERELMDENADPNLLRSMIDWQRPTEESK